MVPVYLSKLYTLSTPQRGWHYHRHSTQKALPSAQQGEGITIGTAHKRHYHRHSTQTGITIGIAKGRHYHRHSTQKDITMDIAQGCSGGIALPWAEHGTRHYHGHSTRYQHQAHNTKALTFAYSRHTALPRWAPGTQHEGPDIRVAGTQHYPNEHQAHSMKALTFAY